MEHKHSKYNIPSIFVILGVTGDLSTKKIIPSLWQLFLHKLLPEHLLIVGFARRVMNKEEFSSFVKDSIVSHSNHKIEEDDFDTFLNYFTYHSGEFADQKAFESLRDLIKATDDSWGVCTNKLFYLSVQSAAYSDIFKNLASVELNLPCGGELGWSRILIEKPFGLDMESAKNLQSLLSSYFKEEQIYRIDHYLFKEIIQGIENFRFSNNLFEKNWDNSTVEKIELRLLESIGVEDRGNFYDPVGTLRDVGQNHLLSMLSVLLMEFPIQSNPDSVRGERAKVIESLSPWQENSLKEKVIRAQYGSYKDIKGVGENSETETYFSLETEVLSPRWQGVPIFLEAGKRTGATKKEIVVTLKHPDNCLLCSEISHKQNRIIFSLGAKDEILIKFWTKKPGFESEGEERTLSFFLYEKEESYPYVEEYSKVLHDAIGGDQSRFSGEAEIENAWRFIDPVVDSWKNNITPLYIYENDTIPTKKLKEEYRIEKLNNEVGMIGLGKMGGNLAKRLLSKNWKVVGYNKDENLSLELQREGLTLASSIEEIASQMKGPRTVWIMVPFQAVDSVIEELAQYLDHGDTIIDGGNSPFRESARRCSELKDKGINFLDVGVSGGPEGARMGSCIMVGGDKKTFEEHKSLFEDLATKNGFEYVGPSGAGHFVKMVHNGIEYGMMQSIGEGFEIMKSSNYSLDLGKIAELYNHESVISSKLIGWLSVAYKNFGNGLDKEECCTGVVPHSGEGEWAVNVAHEMNIPVAVIEAALEFRKASAQNPTYTGQVISALRHEFGGHDANIKPCACDADGKK